MTINIKSKIQNPKSKITIIVLGGGESGVGAAILAQKLKFDVFLSDKNKIPEKFKTELIQHQIPFEEEQHTEDKILAADIVVKSPGIPDKVALIQKLKEKNIPIISEIEWAARFTHTKIIAITGSNGKTTTTSLIYHLLKTAKLKVEVGGNIGYSFARLVAEEIDEKKSDYYVLEISSFQLDGIETFKPYIGIITNITPDHLDRYDYKMENYVASKFRITKNQTSDDLLILNADDAETKLYLDNRRWTTEDGKGKTNSHSVQARQLFLPMSFTGDILMHDFNMLQTPLRGVHNYFNAACAISVAKEIGINARAIKKGLKTFVVPEHRLEPVATINGVEWINDSKATNVDSVAWALKAMKKPTILILGGLDKGNDYNLIADLVKEKVRAIVAMGVNNEKIISFFSALYIETHDTHSISDAISTCKKISKSGDVVLLSPACASFDLFKNYEDRGQQFKEMVIA